MKQNPFSLYDFLGYLIPGTLFLYTCLYLPDIFSNGDFHIGKINEIQKRYSFDNYFYFIMFAYTTGHLLSFISSITIERFSNWSFGYPSKFVLGYKKHGYLMEMKSGTESNTIYEIAETKWKCVINNMIRIFLLMFILPISIFNFILGNWFDFKNFYQKKLDNTLIEAIRQKMEFMFKRLKVHNLTKGKDLMTFDFHRIVSHYAFEYNKEHQFRMVNYVALYGFLRNITLLFNLSFWGTIYVSFSSISVNAEIDWYKLLFIIILSLVTYISFMAYMKFYRRYTLEGLMLILIDKELTDD